MAVDVVAVATVVVAMVAGWRRPRGEAVGVLWSGVVWCGMVQGVQPLDM